MKYFTLTVIAAVLILFTQAKANPAPPEREFYEIRIFSLSTVEQEKIVDKYLREALIPALHRNNINHVGVFKALANDTASVRKTYVLIPYKSLDQFNSITEKIEKDKEYLSKGSDYINAPDSTPPYLRIEKILSKAFTGMPLMEPVKLTAPFGERVYEMRSYESHTEKLHAKKVDMFNTGNEIGLFKRLGFHAVFYSQAITGTALPNLIYMITFDNMAAHDKLWDAFRNDPEWKKLSSQDQYQHVMYKADSYLLRPTDYSDY